MGFGLKGNEMAGSSSDWAWAMAIVILVIFCAGDPDLIDALIHYLMK